MMLLSRKPVFFSVLRSARMSSVAAIRLPSNKEIKVHTGLFINNEFVPSVNNSQELIRFAPSSAADLRRRVH